MECVTLANDVKMPILGLGVYQVESHKQCESTVISALNNGYRLIDTAEGYMNEEAVGSGIRKSSVKREDVFVTSKLWIKNFGYEKTKIAYEAQLILLFNKTV